MGKLTKRQKELCYYVASGLTVKKSDELAGFAKGESGRVNAQRALKLPHVQEQLRKEVNELIGLSAVNATHKISDLSMNAKSEYVQLEASKDILDRGGYGKEQPLLNLNGQDMKILIDLG